MPTAKRLRDKNRAKARKAIGKGKLLSAKSIKKVELEYKIVCMRRDGYTVQEVADTLRISTSTVRECVKNCLERAITEMNETTEEHRQLQLERLDSLIKANLPYARGFDTEVVDPKTGALKIIKTPPNPAYAQLILSAESRRAKLLALDIPETKKLDITGVREYYGVDVEKV